MIRVIIAEDLDILRRRLVKAIIACYQEEEEKDWNA